ncbi:hypothetical protein LTR27_000004 [Elasticomyces elasticus]|nr:hypothetical protein LTR27_000004 [Elasticomyces elasticus]
MQSSRTFQFIGDPYHKVPRGANIVEVVEITTTNQDNQENLSGRVTAACVNCRRKKIKCGGGSECQACQEKGLVCDGPSFRKRASNDDEFVATISRDSDGASDVLLTSSMEEGVMESQDAKYDTIQQLLSSMKPEAGCEGPELNLKSASQYVPITSASRSAEGVGARPSRLIYPMPIRHPPHRGIAAALERRLEDDKSHSHRSPGHLIQEAEVLEEKAGVLRQLASLRLHDEAVRVHNEVQRHHEQQQQQHYHHHHHVLPLPSSQQPRSHPSNPNQAAFGGPSPALSMSSGPECWPSRYQFDASTIFRPDGVTLRTGLTSRGGEFGNWDHVNMQPSHTPGEQQQQQHRLDFSTSPNYEMQQQQLPQAPSSSRRQNALLTGSSTASSSSTTGFRRMQAAFHTQLEAQYSGDGKGEGRFRAYHPPQ